VGSRIEIQHQVISPNTFTANIDFLGRGCIILTITLLIILMELSPREATIN